MKTTMERYSKEYFEKQRQYVEKDQKNLRSKFDHNYIAVKGGEVVYDGSELITLLERLEDEHIDGAIIGTIDMILAGKGSIN